MYTIMAWYFAVPMVVESTGPAGSIPGIGRPIPYNFDMQDTWQSLEISGKQADVYEPAGVSRPHFGLLYLHGSSGETLRDRPVFANMLNELKFACICPYGRRSWWSERICAEFDPRLSAERYLLDQVLPFSRKRWSLAPRAIGLLGISMGVQAALRLGFE